MRRACLLLTTLALTGSVASPAQAARIVGTVSGVVTSADEMGPDLLPPGVEAGDTIAISWSYESTATPTTDDESGILYVEGLDLAFSIQIEAHRWEATGGALRVTNDEGLDAHGLSARGMQIYPAPVFTTVPTAADPAIHEFVFGLVDQSAPFTLVDSTALPVATADLDLGAVTLTPGELEAEFLYSILFDLDPLSLTLVPEPSVLGLAGLALLAARRERRGRSR